MILTTREDITESEQLLLDFYNAPCSHNCRECELVIFCSDVIEYIITKM